MGKKYIIEIIEKPFKDDAGREVWRAKGFNTLYFDQNGLDKLEEYKEPAKHTSSKLEVGDVFYLSTSSYAGKIILTYIDDSTVSYIWYNGMVGSSYRTLFEERAAFIYHSDTLKEFLGGE